VSFDAEPANRRRAYAALGAAVAVVCAVWLGAALPAHADSIELIQNGGFETGDFSHWEVSDPPPFPGGCNTPWNVSDVGGAAATGCQPGLSGSFPGAPLEGSYAAYHSFDAFDTPTLLRLRQEFVVPDFLANAVLSFAWTVNLDFTIGNTPTQPRRFQVDITEPGRVLARPHEQLFPGEPPFDDDPESFDLDWSFTQVDLTELLQSHLGQTLALRITHTVPQSQTGPGGFGLDAVSLFVVTPEPASALLVALGLLVAARHRCAPRGDP
jgi:hypothetical protein